MANDLCPSSLWNHSLNPTHFASFQHYFYSMRMIWRIGKDAFYKPFGDFARSLVVFLNYFHFIANVYIFSVSAVHYELIIV